MAIRERIEGEAVCREIVCYLIRHCEAADTPRGIAKGWIDADIPSTTDALSRLRGPRSYSGPESS